MKLALAAIKPDVESNLANRFGRCTYFIIYDTVTRTWDSLPNPASDSHGGAGTQAAQFVANLGIKALISGKIGPKACSVLETANIQVIETKSGKISNLIDDFIEGKLGAAEGRSDNLA